jgi:hypothetical protein
VRETARTDVTAKRARNACASPAAYDKLKGLIFDQAIGQHAGDRANLDTLADYSLARMEDPVVAGADPSLDITKCQGRFILEVPPGSERGLAGERRLQADIDYTAQAAADGNGLVYRLEGAEPIVARLAAFNLTSVAYRPPPAIDEQHGAEPAAAAQANAAAPLPSPVRSEEAPDRRPIRYAQRQTIAPREALERADPEPGTTTPPSPTNGTGEATVRAFYSALGTADGASASARVIPQKRSSGTFSPQALSRFYGSLLEPIRLNAIEPIAPGSYHVSYRYSAGRSRCAGSAVVSLTTIDGSNLIRSIRALNGC